MSRQPAQTNVMHIDEYRRSKADGSLEMGPETDVSFRESDLPREIIRVGSLAVNQSEKIEVSRVAAAQAELLTLHRIRDQYKEINETDFIANDDLKAAV